MQLVYNIGPNKSEGTPGNIDVEEVTAGIVSNLTDLMIHPRPNVQFTNETTDNKLISNLTKKNNILPEVKSKVLYHNPAHNSWSKAYILGRAGEAGSRNSA